MKVTNKQLESFQLNSEAWLNKENGKVNKFLFALGKIKKKTKSLYESYMEKIQELRIEFASVDEKGNVMMKENHIDYKPEKVKELQKKIKEEGAKEIEIEPHYAKPPKDLPWAFKEVFLKFVIEDKEEEEPAQEADGDQKEEKKSN